jgi:hypothetical protein
MPSQHAAAPTPDLVEAMEQRAPSRKSGSFKGWAFAMVVLLPAILYHAYFWSLDEPPGHPSPNSDGDWAMLGYLTGLPYLFLVTVLMGGFALLGFTLAKRSQRRRSGQNDR